MDFGDVGALLAEQICEHVRRSGAHLFPEPLRQASAVALLADLRNTRAFDDSLFLTQAEFDANPQHRGVNPRPGRNLLEGREDQLAFVEQNPQVVHALGALLGRDYTLLDRKVVCGVPRTSVPGWLRERIEGAPVNNLGAYVRPEYRDVTYFYGIDFHQDLIDFKDRDPDFLTLYVYLHDVGPEDAPLHLLEGSHRLGASVFPHALDRISDGGWRYANGEHGSVQVRDHVLTGPAGFAALWHACTLHGTQPDAGDRARLSLRYLFSRGETAREVGIDRVNAGLSGPLRLSDTRVDLDATGAAQIRRNTVNQG